MGTPRFSLHECPSSPRNSFLRVGDENNRPKGAFCTNSLIKFEIDFGKRDYWQLGCLPLHRVISYIILKPGTPIDSLL